MNIIKGQKRILAWILAASCLVGIIAATPHATQASELGQEEIVVAVNRVKVNGIKHFTYKINRSRWDPYLPGLGESPRSKNEDNVLIRGKISVTGESHFLKKLMDKEEAFDLVLSLSHQSYSSNGTNRQLAFDECRIIARETRIRIHGHPVTVYSFVAEQIDEE
ncbi:MAG: hypothetical protein GY847_06000 [Proteobacteria bacterium]|nr:hypothetical protein [Pseudomonadota bacterium]